MVNPITFFSLADGIFGCGFDDIRRKLSSSCIRSADHSLYLSGPAQRRRRPAKRSDLLFHVHLVRRAHRGNVVGASINQAILIGNGGLFSAARSRWLFFSRSLCGNDSGYASKCGFIGRLCFLDQSLGHPIRLHRVPRTLGPQRRKRSRYFGICDNTAYDVCTVRISKLVLGLPVAEEVQPCSLAAPQVRLTFPSFRVCVLVEFPNLRLWPEGGYSGMHTGLTRGGYRKTFL
jgi:hypothetical protein